MNPIDVLRKFDITFIEAPDRMFGKCPIHGGDNTTAFSMFKDNGCWTCFTHGCQQQFGNSIFGFTKAMLAKAENIPFISYPNKKVAEFLQMNTTSYVRPKEPEIINVEDIIQNEPIMLREEAEAILSEPSPYYLRRGFQAETLKRFSVSEIPNARLMEGRAIVPIFDPEGINLIGFSGRSTGTRKPKWLHSQDFHRNLSLYNSWSIGVSPDYVIVTEGCAKVWRLFEAGISNAVGIYGTFMSDFQIGLLNSIGPSRVYILMDNDEPGKTAAKNIEKKLAGFYKTVILDTDIVDVDQESVEKVQRVISPLIY